MTTVTFILMSYKSKFRFISNFSCKIFYFKLFPLARKHYKWCELPYSHKIIQNIPLNLNYPYQLYIKPLLIQVISFATVKTLQKRAQIEYIHINLHCFVDFLHILLYEECQLSSELMKYVYYTNIH